MKLILCLLALLAVVLAVPVNIMAPLDIMTNDGHLKDASHTYWQLKQLRAMGAHGLMLDVWWGIGETSPKQYNFGGYLQLAQMIKSLGMKMQCVMSFHKCGGNVGDACNIPLPQFVRDVGNNNPDIWYTDKHGNRDDEYISLWADNERIFAGRNPLEMYDDYVGAFIDAMGDLIGSTIDELQIGLGPCGETRFPGYQLSHWSFCGVGEFQSYDKYALQSLKQAAATAGHSEWGHGGPSNAGDYNSMPYNTGFFSNGNDNYASEYGRFFLGWYSGSLEHHADIVLGRVQNVVQNRVSLAAKIAGIHWWYNSPHHAAELTAGYFNSDNHDGYGELAQVFARHNTTLDFTCLEMRDTEQPATCGCEPEELVSQVHQAANQNGIPFSGENALPRRDWTAYNQILKMAKGSEAFTFLRLDDALVQQNYNDFKNFINKMKYD
eukprot:TRINITY_DN243_c0_g1_i1.p1 TRINITY_DN243_c0_g1~~TRINITY_DN243_c0_g1_i1.p1  ORF type:complete len:436 (-),score=162.00 TRINITY_DN243_c0_g1_i1:412-1719(-)